MPRDRPLCKPEREDADCSPRRWAPPGRRHRLLRSDRAKARQCRQPEEADGGRAEADRQQPLDRLPEGAAGGAFGGRFQPCEGDAEERPTRSPSSRSRSSSRGASTTSSPSCSGCAIWCGSTTATSLPQDVSSTSATSRSVRFRRRRARPPLGLRVPLGSSRRSRTSRQSSRSTPSCRSRRKRPRPCPAAPMRPRPPRPARRRTRLQPPRARAEGLHEPQEENAERPG